MFDVHDMVFMPINNQFPKLIPKNQESWFFPYKHYTLGLENNSYINLLYYIKKDRKG